MADEVEDLKQSPEPVIEPYCQAQAKQLIDTLFDLGLLSESMSRDGIDNVEGLVALYFQQIATSAAKCAGFGKKYKVLAGRLKKDDNDERKRHEEEMRWIARAKEAEKEVSELRDHVLFMDQEIVKMRRMAQAEAGALSDPFKVARWVADAGGLLENILGPFAVGNLGVLRATARGLLDRGMNEGVLPDCRSGETWQVRPEDGCACPPENQYPGMVIPEFCLKCGGRKIF
jgi:hypothetical protein